MAGEVLTVGAVGIPLTYALKKAFQKAGIYMAKRKGEKLDDDEDALGEMKNEE